MTGYVHCFCVCDFFEILGVFFQIITVFTFRPTLPIELSRKEVRDCLFKDKCLATILDLAGQGKVSLHSFIKAEEIKKGDIIGKGGTAIVYCATYNNSKVAYKEFIEGSVTMSEFRREVALMRYI